jgi:hypothetical protein
LKMEKAVLRLAQGSVGRERSDAQIGVAFFFWTKINALTRS